MAEAAKLLAHECAADEKLAREELLAAFRRGNVPAIADRYISKSQGDLGSRTLSRSDWTVCVPDWERSAIYVDDDFVLRRAASIAEYNAKARPYRSMPPWQPPPVTITAGIGVRIATDFSEYVPALRDRLRVVIEKIEWNARVSKLKNDPVATDTSPEALEVASKSKGGRSPSPLWDRILVEAASFLHANDRSTTLQAVVEHIQRVFSDTAPKDTQLKVRLSPLWRRFRDDDAE